MYKQKRVPQYMQKMQDQASLWLWASESAVEDASILRGGIHQR